MVIKRVVNGVELSFELTDKELSDAFFEQRDKFDLEDIKTEFMWQEEADLFECYGKSYEELELLFPEMAYEMRRNMDKYDMDFVIARHAAICDVISRHENEKSGGCDGN